MVKTVTQEQLIQFLYQEVTTAEATAIAEAIRCDWELMEQYEMFRETMQQLDAARVTPSQAVVDRIKRYSESTAPMEHLL